jgi:hypothetical protein
MGDVVIEHELRGAVAIDVENVETGRLRRARPRQNGQPVLTAGGGRVQGEGFPRSVFVRIARSRLVPRQPLPVTVIDLA